ncbi:nucleoporin autopeptidase-domain-containing protein [Rhodofomes roseus]|uniref:Nucleoporin autopeptidase-domain-containing protein n=1 Tax=Rhodofomes roseus TaxID=34475 RepID=A0A4Y9Y4C0_9APHY|nr:nucleoporin autopeptidase-domain-containing protein [Rhodofomes roseus]KAH9833799.1 nucleoporin autopeptidase-domain-containing protein [Rhodofomes roseus]TFY56427.1 hypothetical protein EVJ58_g7652 [Rhodofomes roseus]
MFGSNTGSSWGNPQGNQQQPGAFGQPAGFGAGNAFGSAPNANAFGQPQPQQQQQQQQQPQANPMFGSLGGASTATPSSTGFGAFGGAPNNTANSGGLFGQPKPTTGFGAFGSTGTTNTFGAPATGAFGSTTQAGPSTGGGVFGQPSQPSTSTNAFGGGNGLFGSKPTTGFGTTTTPAAGVPAPVTTGSSNPSYAPYAEKEGNSTLTLHYQSISCMPQYRGSSFEEIRVQDYQQGRKTAAATAAGGYGQTAFGAPAQQQSNGLFGQPAQNAAAPATNSMFGSFGNANNGTTNTGTTGLGAFGQPQNNTNTSGTGLFGGGGAFGQQNPQQQPQQQQQQQPTTTGFGAFGQPQQQQNPTGGGLFGSSNAFGANNQQKPAGFGTFGNAGTTGAFGQPQNQQQQQNTPGIGLFGQPAQQQQNTGGFGAFGSNNNAQKPGLFGQPAQSNAGLGAFGQQNQQQPQQQPQAGGGLFGTNTNTGGGLFGNTNNQQQPQQQQPGTGLFGQPAQQPTTGGGLFGGGGGLFGNNNQNQQQQQQQPAQNTGFGLFGAPKPAAPATTNTGGGLFGSTYGQPAQNTTQTNPNPLFGSTLGAPPNNQQNTNTFGSGGLFGKPAAPLGTAPSAGQQGAGLGGSLFGNAFGQSTNNMNTSMLGQNTQPQLTASIAQPVLTNLPIFSMLPPGPRSIPLDTQPKKKTGYFSDIPTRTPLPRLGLGYTPAVSKLRGYTSTSPAPGANGASSNVLFGSSKPNALSLSKTANGKSTLGPETFLTGGSPSPTLGTGGRKSFKKLILDRKVEAADLLAKSSVANGSRITFSPALSVAAREREAAAAVNRASPGPRGHDSPSPAPQRDRASNRFTADAHRAGSHGASPQEEDVGELREGDYWVTPDLSTLKRMSHEELVSVKGLAVGRKGYGVITFLEPVDLTNVPKLAGLLGELVRFDDKECSVYPDSDEAEKPPPGSGLNVKARIELYRCWALDKATREPIKDETNPHALRHVKRLKNMKHTHFEGFDIEEGKWTFTVDHF